MSVDNIYLMEYEMKFNITTRMIAAIVVTSVCILLLGNSVQANQERTDSPREDYFNTAISIDAADIDALTGTQIMSDTPSGSWECLPDDAREAILGQLRLATDHQKYFWLICEVLLGPQPENPNPVEFTSEEAEQIRQIQRSFQPVNFYPTDAADPGEWVGSNFERKYLKEGRPIYTLALQKI